MKWRHMRWSWTRFYFNFDTNRKNLRKNSARPIVTGLLGNNFILRGTWVTNNWKHQSNQPEVMHERHLTSTTLVVYIYYYYYSLVLFFQNNATFPFSYAWTTEPIQFSRPFHKDSETFANDFISNVVAWCVQLAFPRIKDFKDFLATTCGDGFEMWTSVCTKAGAFRRLRGSKAVAT